MGLRERIFGRKDDTAFQFSANAAQADLANPNNQNQEQEYYQTLNKLTYLIDTPALQQFFVNYKELNDLIPAFQTPIRTTKINKREAEVMWLNYKILFLKKKAELYSLHPYEDFTALFLALEILADSIISDALDGWKGHLTTEQVRRLDVVLNKKDKWR